MFTLLLQAFFASDGRSKKQQPQVEDTKPKYTCTECGKNYATSSNLSRHRQTHRTLDSTNAKKCPICNKVTRVKVIYYSSLLTFFLFRCMSACPPCQCTSWPTAWATSAMFVAKLSPGPGCSRVTWGHTPGTNPMVVLIVANLLLTGGNREKYPGLWINVIFTSGPIFVLTCRPIRLSRTSIANDAINPLHSSPISTNTTSRPVLKTSPFHP